MFKVVIEFIHSPQKRNIPPKRLNYKLFLSKILKFGFNLKKKSVKKKSERKNLI